MDLGLDLGLVRFGQENARKSGFVFFSVFVEDELVLNSCGFWILIMFFLFYFVKVDTLKKKKLDDDVTFFNIILMVISAFNVLTMHSVCHIEYLC